MKKQEEEFNDWFDNLTIEEQKQYFAELEAEKSIEESKEWANEVLDYTE